MARGDDQRFVYPVEMELARHIRAGLTRTWGDDRRGVYPEPKPKELPLRPGATISDWVAHTPRSRLALADGGPRRRGVCRRG